MIKRRTLLTIAAVFCVAATLSCGGTSDSAPANPSTPAPAASTSPSSHVQTVTIESPDKTILVGSLFESSKPNSPALLLLHQWQSDRHSYDEFAEKLQERGFTVLSIDGRGFGGSIKKTDGSSVSAGRTDADVKAMQSDVAAAFDFLADQKSVDDSNIGIVGASYGSSLAVIYAAQNPKVRAVALISPGLNYFGNMPIEAAITKWGERWLYLFAAEDDKESAAAVRRLGVTKKGPNMHEKIYPSGGHGESLFRANVGFKEDLETFLESMKLNPVH